MKNSEYHTTIENTAGIKGAVRALSGGTTVFTTASPVKADQGTNPEQLLGAALATCLNATLELQERKRGLPHTAVVRVRVDFVTVGDGYEFFLNVQVKIPGADPKVAAEMLATAEHRCPVAKLIGGHPNVTVRLVTDFVGEL